MIVNAKFKIHDASHYELVQRELMVQGSQWAEPRPYEIRRWDKTIEFLLINFNGNLTLSSVVSEDYELFEDFYPEKRTFTDARTMEKLYPQAVLIYTSFKSEGIDMETAVQMAIEMLNEVYLTLEEK